MDITTTYRDIIKRTILQYAQLRPSHGDIRLDVVFDETHDRFALMQVGWDRGRRVRGNLVYVTIHDEKVYIEYDGIEHGITDDLIAEGISEDRIILAFLPGAPTAADTQVKARLSQTKTAILAADASRDTERGTTVHKAPVA